MIPLRALLFRGTFPSATVTIIILNVFCFLFEMVMSPYAQNNFLVHYALIPDHLHLSALLTSMFIHGGWLHLIGNMWFLWIYGSYVEDALGPAKFTVFYLISGVAAALVHLIVNVGSPIPVIGASGAIAGVMGAFLVLFPHARILTLIFIIFFITTIEVPAAFLLIYWFIIQFFSGISSIGRFASAGNIAWFAHVGGFLAGMFLLRYFGGNTGRGNRRRYSY